MKRELLLWISLGSGVVVSLWWTTGFRETQETYFKNVKSERGALQTNLKILKNDLVFMRDHQKELNFLDKKGWFLPKNRLIAGEILEKLPHSLNEVEYTFEPEITKTIRERYAFKVTKIVFEVGALLDSDIYAFVHEILEKFPGILIPYEFTLTRGEEVSEKNILALRQNRRSNFVVGKLIFEWFALGKENHEK